MAKSSRHRYKSAAGKSTTVTARRSVTVNSQSAAIPKGGLIHHVFFWLRNPERAEDKAALIEGLQKLTAVKTIRQYHIGQPAGTTRDVIDGSYSVSWLLYFKDKADEESYQKDPTHLKFVETCSGLWSKVIVYDSVNA